ncbi:MAG: hypothetical protein ABIQ52_05820 [Vicinamibacterales bacterium]
MIITGQQLAGHLGKSIADLCSNGYNSAAENHSAHFVSHVLGFQTGVTCQMMSASSKGPAATLRVPDLFFRCRSVGAWSLRPASVRTALVFITRAANVNLSTKVMANVPRTHVGIFAEGFVWHYSNSQQKVIRQTPAQFALHYTAPDNAMFFGTVR